MKIVYGNESVSEVLDIAFKSSIPALLVGPTGSGKNTILRAVAKKHKREDIIRLSLTGETTVDDLIGHYQIKDQSTVWQDGSVTHAVREGLVLVLDEVNAAQPEVLFALQSLLDDDRCLTLTSHDNSVVKAHPNFRVFATMNPTNGYSGTKNMNKAFLSRFGLVLNVDYISAEDERELISSRMPELKSDDLMVMLETAQQARRKLANDELTFPLSTRDILNWAQMCCELQDLLASFNHTVVTKAEGDGKELLNILKTSISENSSRSSYLRGLEADIDKLANELAAGNTSIRSLYREQADKAVVLLEKLREIATDQTHLKEEAVKETKENMAEARKQLKAASAKLAEDAKELDGKYKAIYQEGYDKAKNEIFAKLGVPESKV